MLLQSRRRFGELSEALTNALVTLLTDRMVDAAFPEADARPDDWRLYLVLDEIAQSRKIEALQSLSSAGRSKGLHLFVGLQSVTQLKKIYGPEFADLLYTNLLTRYVGRTPDGDGAEWLARKLGTREIERLADTVSFTAADQGPSEQHGWTWRREKLAVLLPSQLASELGPDFRRHRIRALLSVAGGSHVLRLAWPKVGYPAVRPALLDAAWVSGGVAAPDGGGGRRTGASGETAERRRTRRRRARRRAANRRERRRTRTRTRGRSARPWRCGTRSWRTGNRRRRPASRRPCCRCTGWARPARARRAITPRWRGTTITPRAASRPASGSAKARRRWA